MTEELLINFTPRETRVACIQQGAVQELFFEREDARGLVGNIYWGQVVRVLPGLQSAFIDAGLARTAFLHVADIWEEESGQELSGEKTHMPSGGRSIQKLLSVGDKVMVQVAKDPIGNKGARLTTHISLAGRLLVYLPQETRVIGVSLRISEEDIRQQMRQRILSLLPEGMSGGYILRTAATQASEDELQQDIEYLQHRWKEMLHHRDTVQEAPRLLYQELSLSQRVLRDRVQGGEHRVLIDSGEIYRELIDFAKQYMPRVLPTMEYYSGPRPLFDLYGVDHEIEKALARRVDLKSGGYLVFDQTEAMTIVDVNSGSFISARNQDETIYKTNLDAAVTIAHQLRLRNLGGIIIIDFIDMEKSEHKEGVLDALRKGLERDHTYTTISRFSQLGLVEITRKRTRDSLSHLLCETCPTCNGRGEIKTARSVCYEVLRELMREARQFQASEYRLLASPLVVEMLEDEESNALAMLSDLIGLPISLQAEIGYTQEQYDIVLL